ncbi:MAG: LysM domain-containing protein [Desulfosporosinus sp.]|nr:LysM domain-containing protein [Desulfosporosinus sp.]
MYYYVQPGDSLHSIAMRYNTTVGNLMDLNPQISNPHRIHVGERIKVSSGKNWGHNNWGGNEWNRNQWNRNQGSKNKSGHHHR